MKQSHVFKLLAVLVVAALAWWLFTNTEWVEVDVDSELQGEALTNEHYALHKLGRALGAQMVLAKNLDHMPPPKASLWLRSGYWDMFEGRAQRLQNWVQRGGHLVIDAHLLDDERLQAWLPVEEVEPKQSEDDAAEPQPLAPAPASTPASAAAPKKPRQCWPLAEAAPGKQAYPGRSEFNVCGYTYGALKARKPAQWALHAEHGPQVVRVAVGQGSVTAINLQVFDNHALLKGDNALLAVAVMGIKPGAQVWTVAQEAREPLLQVLWQQAWVVVLLGLAALLMALWRGAVRFGPPVLDTAQARRSMREQIQGTARFLQQHGRPTLYQAQLTALDDAAKSRVPGWRHLSRTDRAQALAQRTQMPPDDLLRALDHSLQRSTGDFLWTLQTLETARRRLRDPSIDTHTSSNDKDTS